MKITSDILFTFLIAAPFCANADLQDIQPISVSEAAAIVQTQEKAREHAKDEKEAALRSAPIRGTAVADLGSRKVEFNRVDLPKARKASARQVERVAANFDEAAFFAHEAKEQLAFTLSGTVRDGISELWWFYEGHRYQVFSNANFLYLASVSEYESEETIYSLFPIIVEGSSDLPIPEGEWRPTWKDFSTDQLEYYVTQSSGDKRIDTKAFKLIELMLIKYGEDFDQLKIIYENGQKMSAARTAYLKANPPKKRDTIINFAPIDKNARSAATN